MGKTFVLAATLMTCGGVHALATSSQAMRTAQEIAHDIGADVSAPPANDIPSPALEAAPQSAAKAANDENNPGPLDCDGRTCQQWGFADAYNAERAMYLEKRALQVAGDTVLSSRFYKDSANGWGFIIKYARS